MARLRCKSCLGEYTSPQGTMAYFHACSPTVTPGLQPNPTLPLYTPPTVAERPNKRDENPRVVGFALDKDGALTTLTEITSAGDGVLVIG